MEATDNDKEQILPLRKSSYERTMDVKGGRGIVVAADEKVSNYEESTKHNASGHSDFSRKFDAKGVKGVWWGLKDEDKEGKFSYHEKIKFE